jgi:hypothetical protein
MMKLLTAAHFGLWRFSWFGHNRLLKICEDYYSSTRLEQALDLGVDLLSHPRLRVVDHHHRSVRKIAYPLALILAFTNNPLRHHCAG